MHPYVRLVIKNAVLCSALVLAGACLLILVCDADRFLLQMRSALFGCAVFSLVHIVFHISAFLIPAKMLTAGMVLYRAVYSYVLKYLLLFFLFYICLKFRLVVPVTFVMSFVAALCCNLIYSMTKSTKL